MRTQRSYGQLPRLSDGVSILTRALTLWTSWPFTKLSHPRRELREEIFTSRLRRQPGWRVPRHLRDFSPRLVILRVKWPRLYLVASDFQTTRCSVILYLERRAIVYTLAVIAHRSTLTDSYIESKEFSKRFLFATVHQRRSWNLDRNLAENIEFRTRRSPNASRAAKIDRIIKKVRVNGYAIWKLLIFSSTDRVKTIPRAPSHESRGRGSNRRRWQAGSLCFSQTLVQTRHKFP